MGFENFMYQVDNAMAELTGGVIHHHDDLADFTYRDWFEDGATPAETAEDAIVSDGMAAAFLGW